MFRCDTQLSPAWGHSLLLTLLVSSITIILSNRPSLLLMTFLAWSSSPGNSCASPLSLLLNENICLRIPFLQYHTTPENITVQLPHSACRVIIPYYCNVSAALFFSAPCLILPSHEQAPGTPLVDSLLFPGCKKSKKNGNNSFPLAPMVALTVPTKDRKKESTGDDRCD